MNFRRPELVRTIRRGQHFSHLFVFPRHAPLPCSSASLSALRSSCVPTRFPSPSYPRYPRAPRRMRDSYGTILSSRLTRCCGPPWLGRSQQCVHFPLKCPRVTVLFDLESSTTDVCLCLSALPLTTATLDPRLVSIFGGEAFLSQLNAALAQVVRRQNRCTSTRGMLV